MKKKLSDLLRLEFRFLARPLNLWSRILLLLAAATIVTSLFFPLWRMHLVAPQYSDGLDLFIYSYKIVGGGLMASTSSRLTISIITSEWPRSLRRDFLEMRWMPFVFGFITLLILRSIVFGQMGNLVDLFAVYCYFGLFSIGSFWYRLYQYGHNLDPHAAVHIKPFTPRLLGTEQIANFRESSYPELGAILLCASVLMIIIAGWVSRKETVATI